jgi:hypothetical protein
MRSRGLGHDARLCYDKGLIAGFQPAPGWDCLATDMEVDRWRA